jgi:hypothetical protein
MFFLPQHPFARMPRQRFRQMSWPLSNATPSRSTHNDRIIVVSHLVESRRPLCHLPEVGVEGQCSFGSLNKDGGYKCESDRECIAKGCAPGLRRYEAQNLPGTEHINPANLILEGEKLCEIQKQRGDYCADIYMSAFDQNTKNWAKGVYVCPPK